MEKRNLFQSIFNKNKSNNINTNSNNNNYSSFQLLSGYSPIFTNFGDNAYSSDIVRSTIHCIATNVGKLKAKHIRRVEGKIINTNSNIEKLLSVRPNPYMNAFDFLYKVTTNLYLKNNAFIYTQTDNSGNIIGFFPVNPSSVELLQNNSNDLYCQFKFVTGQTIVIPYSEIIHLRRFYNENDFYGESNSQALLPTLELVNTTNQGIINAVKSSAYLRGLLKLHNVNLKPNDIKAQKDQFVADYMTMNNNGGIAALDSKSEYQELKNNPVLIDDKQMELIEDKVYKYFNVNKNIVTSQYNEEEWDAFYEGIIEPIALQLGLEFTSKLFTSKEQGFGNEVLFQSNRLQYASTKTKISLLKELQPLSLFTINEGREIFNMSPVEDGDKRIQTLNVVNAGKADKYQGVGEGEENNE